MLVEGVLMELSINGQTYSVASEPGNRLLLWVLRDELGLTGTKFGCGIAMCGSCTVLMDGQPTRTCVTPLSASAGKSIVTLEGLAATGADGAVTLHPVQRAFEEEQVHQCGYCMTGQMLTAVALLRSNPSPNDAEIVAGMDRVLCRCGAYVRIKRAVARAAEIAAQEGGL
jgi:isoquinoline 1-oxidoreductase alpha subunit